MKLLKRIEAKPAVPVASASSANSKIVEDLEVSEIGKALLKVWKSLSPPVEESSLKNSWLAAVYEDKKKHQYWFCGVIFMFTLKRIIFLYIKQKSFNI